MVDDGADVFDELADRYPDCTLGDITHSIPQFFGDDGRLIEQPRDGRQRGQGILWMPDGPVAIAWELETIETE